MKILFLFPYPIGESPSQRFRFEHYLDKLAFHNITHSSQSFWDLDTWRILYKSGNFGLKIWGFVFGFLRRVFVLFKMHDVDFVFIHRECMPVGPPAIEWIIAKILKKKIIYDFDDAIWLPDSINESKLKSFVKWQRKIGSICRWSYKISCGNAYLAAFARQFNSNTIVIPTIVDTENLHNPSLFKMPTKKGVVTIGWTGTHSTLKYLDGIVPVIQKLEELHPLRFLVIANKRPELPIKSLDFIPWSKAHEIKDLLQFDIGIMPLTNDVWTQGKCGFKLLQYLALEIPAVADPVGVNAEIIANGVDGFLCRNLEEWLQHLIRLIEDQELRKKIGKAGRDKIVKRYSVLSNASSFFLLFQ